MENNQNRQNPSTRSDGTAGRTAPMNRRRQQKQKFFHRQDPYSTEGVKSFFKSPPGSTVSTWKSAKSIFAALL